MKKKDRQYAVIATILLMAALALQICARGSEGFATWYAHHIYPVLVAVIGGGFGIFPFSVVEICLYVLSVVTVVFIVRFFKKPKYLLLRGYFLAAVLLFLYTVNCGVNYHAVSFSEYVGLEAGLYSEAELQELCKYLAQRVNETATGDCYAEDRQEWIREGTIAMKTLGEEFDALDGSYPNPKPVAVSWILSVQQLAGIYAPFTIEANFNQAMTDYNIPHTICHELSHLKGFMREDEANFIGYLACTGSDHQAFQYSGYLTGWIHAGNALAKTNIEAYLEIYQTLCVQAKADLRENNEFWGKYEGKVAEAANQWNDTYLKLNRQSDGVQSYGRMVDLMLAYYKDKG